MKFDDLDAVTVEASIPGVESVAFLTQGGQKRVYACEKDGKKYALKLIQVDRTASRAQHTPFESEEPAIDATTARAKREVDILARCKSHHVVKVSGAGLGEVVIDDLTVLYYFEEFVEGEDLKTIIQREGPLDKAELLRLAEQMTLAIESLWNCDDEHRVIHRDIKPANIMRRPNGDFVLLDAGMAYDVLQDSISSSGALPGTLQYVAPERFAPGNKRSMDFRVDMFALGIVLYEAATQRHPFHVRGMTVPDLLQSIMRSTPDDVTKVNPGFPPNLSSLIMRLLAKRPHMRFRSTKHLLERIRSLKEDEEGK